MGCEYGSFCWNCGNDIIETTKIIEGNKKGEGCTYDWVEATIMDNKCGNDIEIEKGEE